MKTLTTWNPFREMEEFQNRFSTVFGGFPTFPVSFPEERRQVQAARLVALGGYHRR